MQRISSCTLVVLVSLSASLRGFAELRSSEPVKTSSNRGWTPLFDGKSLEGWYTCLQGKKRDEDPAKIFQVENGVIHVYKDQAQGAKVPSGFVATKSEYSYYRLRLEYKWGEKRFAGRVAQRRDAGLLYHVAPENRVWPRCIEYQIQEDDVGDCFVVNGTQVDSTVVPDSGPKKLFRYQPSADGGKPQTFGNGGIVRVIKSSTHEHEGWNKIELIVRGSEGSVHIINGNTVFESKAIRQQSPDKKKWLPIDRGHIALQSEYAEVFYRDVEIQPIREGPLHPAAATAKEPASTGG
jgi:hypothetical protein